jgi:hypothetical protein
LKRRCQLETEVFCWLKYRLLGRSLESALKRFNLLLFAASILPLMAQNNGREWNGFAAYPGARQLCDQSVMGQPGGAMMEIHWRSYATLDATEKVIAFYEKTKVKDVEKGSDSITFQLDKDTHLSVYAASAAHYPTCENKPKSDEKTIIVVSRATGR